jgi:hypothetical protein
VHLCFRQANNHRYFVEHQSDLTLQREKKEGVSTSAKACALKTAVSINVTILFRMQQRILLRPIPSCHCPAPSLNGIFHKFDITGNAFLHATSGEKKKKA